MSREVPVTVLRAGWPPAQTQGVGKRQTMRDSVLVRILSFALSEIEAISVAFALRSETI